jgi:hypothetical protein
VPWRHSSRPSRRGVARSVHTVDPSKVKAVVVGAGSVGKFIIQSMNSIGIHPFVKDQHADGARYGVPTASATFVPTLGEAMENATHVAVCCATSGDPIITESDVDALLRGRTAPADPSTTPLVRIVSPSRPDVMAIEGVLKLPPWVHLRFDYGAFILKPVQEKVEAAGGRANVTWSSVAMGSEACHRDMDDATLRRLNPAIPKASL